MLDFFNVVWDAGMRILPAKFNRPEAKAMLIAIGLQESEFKHRKQLGDGPARGFWQFEKEGVRCVLNNPYSAPVIKPLLGAFCYDDYTPEVWGALEHNDLLALLMARLLLYSAPWKLPGPGEAPEAWRQYLWCWRPGKPREETWEDNYNRAWQLS